MKEEAIEQICIETNRLVGQVKAVKITAFPNWKDVTPKELWKFLGLNLAMGLVKKYSIKAYWSTNKTISTPFFGEEMSRNRYANLIFITNLVL